MVQRVMSLRICEWIMVMEGDIFVTNFNFNLSSILAAAEAERDTEVHFIANRDPLANLNTGIFFVRVSDTGQQLLQIIAETRQSHSNDTKLVKWASNGGLIIVHRSTVGRNEVVILNGTHFNSYPGNWRPGAFVVHFAGSKPKSAAMRAFLQQAPLETWLGWNTSFWPLDSAYERELY
jgi:galactosyl transferase GMA12/MNN10 family